MTRSKKMAVSKVAYDGQTLIDLTQDTATESDVASGKYFHKADGTRVQGTASGGSANLQNKIVTLGSALPQPVKADAGYDGLNQVSFSTSNIDAEKIRSGSSVCGVPGTYNGIVPSGTIYIDQNGTHPCNTEEYAVVSVPGGSFGRTITISITEHGSDNNYDIYYRGFDASNNVVWKTQEFDVESGQTVSHAITVVPNLTISGNPYDPKNFLRDGFFLNFPDGAVVGSPTGATYRFYVDDGEGGTGTTSDYYTIDSNTITFNMNS